MSPVTEMPFTESDIKVIKSPMKEQEKVVVQSLTTTVLKQFRRSLVSWKKNTMRMAEATDPSIAKQAAKMSVGAAAGAAVALMTGVGALAGAVGGAAMAFDWLRNQMISKGIDLVTWIVKSPKTAMMFLFIVKQFIKAACKEAAKMFAMATYDRKSKFQQYVGGAKDMLGTIAEGGHISMGTLMRAATSGQTWKSIWKNGGDFVATAVASAIPGGALVKSGASMIVSGCVNCAEEAARTGIELAAYQKDIKTGMQYVGDILTLLLNPKQCMLDNGIVHYSSCGELALDRRACMGAPECKYTPSSGTQPPKCENDCESIQSGDTCRTTQSCKWTGSKCRQQGFFGGGEVNDVGSTAAAVSAEDSSLLTAEEASEVARGEKHRILASERNDGAKDMEARRRLNAFVKRHFG